MTGSERDFLHDEDVAAKVKARRNKLLGRWAAECLGLSGDAAERYAREVLAADLERPGVEDIIGKVAADFAKQGVAHDEHRVRAELHRCTEDAKKQLGGQG